MSYDITTLRGIVPPVVTPLHPDFTVDYASFTNVIEHLIAGGVHGLFFLGSTSEVIFHDLATRRKILEHAVKVTNGRLPVLAGAVDPTTDRVIGNARAASEVGVDAVVVTAPFYTLTSQPEIIEHFRYVRDGIDIPVVAYDLPVCVHSKLERASVVTLARQFPLCAQRSREPSWCVRDDRRRVGGGLRPAARRARRRARPRQCRPWRLCAPV
jgi:4-hydroxy-tetrahydrodipicolinate synthase